MTVSGSESQCPGEKEIDAIKGHGCERGKTYATGEFLSPMRILTSSVKVAGAESPLVPVRSREPIPKEMLLDCVAYLCDVKLTAPVTMHDIVVPDILGTGVDIIATAMAESIS
jgi:CxxC motif-containing protein